MKKTGRTILSLFCLFFWGGCGAIKITPRSCTTESIWGTEAIKALTLDEKPIYFTREDDELGNDSNSDNVKMEELKTKETYFVIADMSVRLKDLLEEHNVNCEDVKKLNLKIETTFFFWREVTLKIDR